MGTFGKGSRGGKRGPSSSSCYASWASTVAMLLFVSFCAFGVYILASSSSYSLLSSSQSSADSRSSRIVLKDSHSSLEESQADASAAEENLGVAGQEETGAAHAGSGASEEDSSQNQNQHDEHGGIESGAQIEHDNESAVDGDETHQQQSQEESIQKVEQQQSEPSSEQIQDTAEQQEQEEQNQNEGQKEEENKSNAQEESLDHNNESHQQKQLEKQIEEDREIENQPRFQQEDPESHSTTSIDEQSKSTETRPLETHAVHVQNDEERQKDDDEKLKPGYDESLLVHKWVLCDVNAGPDYIPCLDNEKAIKKLNSMKHYEHRERHCPDESPTCLVPLPKGYKKSVEWPMSRDKIWYNNVPRTKLAEVKGHQNWVKVDGEYLTFPGGGTQFIHGALHYIDFIQQSQRDISWGKHTRVILDVGCGVASFGGHLFDRDVLTMSFAPKDEHEAQVQFALERGIPGISAVMGSQRLTFPSKVFDLIHCARCRVPWHADGGMLLLELNRVLRPGGYFVWSATPVYQKLKEDADIWKAMTSLTISMCWDLVTIKKDKLNGVAAAIYRKPTTNECYDRRKNQSPPMCEEGDDPNAAWYTPLKTCMHRVPVDATERGTKWPIEWPKRLTVPPYWLNSSETGIYGKPAPHDFKADYDHWKHLVMKSYIDGLGINWSKVRNVMDMRAVYGGFAAALKDLKVWVMNVVNIDSQDTLPIIYERGLFGIYHDWCESFSTYPRTYDLLHADHLFLKLKERCSIVPVLAEIDRIVRPGGKLIVRDESVVTKEVESLLKSLHWDIKVTYNEETGMMVAEKSYWRPEKYSSS